MSKNEEFESELFQNLDMEDKEHLNQPASMTWHWENTTRH